MSPTCVRKALIPCGRKWTTNSLQERMQVLTTLVVTFTTTAFPVSLRNFPWRSFYWRRSDLYSFLYVTSSQRHFENTAGRISPDYHHPDNLERQRRYIELFVTSFVRCTTSVLSPSKVKLEVFKMSRQIAHDTTIRVHMFSQILPDQILSRVLWPHFLKTRSWNTYSRVSMIDRRINHPYKDFTQISKLR